MFDETFPALPAPTLVESATFKDGKWVTNEAAAETSEPVGGAEVAGATEFVDDGPPVDPRWRILTLRDGNLLPAPVTPPPVPRLREEETPEAFFHLFAALERLASGQSAWGITSSVPGEGVTTVALNLALSIARSSYARVCLVDLSLGEDELCRRVGAAPAPAGLIGCLELDQPLAALDWPGPEYLTLIPAGRKPANPARVARAPRIGDLITALRASYDVVIVDMPSIQSDNVAPLAEHLDGLVLVGLAGTTPRAVMQEAIGKIGRDRLVGVVLNRVAHRRTGRSGRRG